VSCCVALRDELTDNALISVFTWPLDAATTITWTGGFRETSLSPSSFFTAAVALPLTRRRPAESFQYVWSAALSQAKSENSRCGLRVCIRPCWGV
jgi:hypothetical protein